MVNYCLGGRVGVDCFGQSVKRAHKVLDLLDL